MVDGVRVDNTPDDVGFGTGGQTISRINDFKPDDIESIEIVKGPSASALYGTAAANGVIVIKTKRGRVGAPVWNVRGWNRASFRCRGVSKQLPWSRFGRE